jgi:hypothetical protein
MSSDILRFATNLCIEQAGLAVRTPVSWRTAALAAVGVASLPLLGVALGCGLLHFVHEERFNRDLLFDLVSRPFDPEKQAIGLAA